MGLLQQQQVIDEEARRILFPVVGREVFLGHAGVAPLPRAAAEAVQRAAHEATLGSQEPEALLREIEATRASAAKLLGAKASEISLIGPTALGLNLVSQGLPWEAGDEVVYYPGDYPANVYPWLALADRGVRPVPLRPSEPGVLTPELVLAAVTPKTRLVALASCHFLTGYRLDYQTIGRELAARGVLFCLDGIQSLGATELDAEYFDFLSADSHKWLLGPLGAGIFYVKERHFEKLRPLLLGSWNVNSPRFIAQTKIELPASGRRYECGSPNALGIVGMKASLDLLLGVGIDRIEARLLGLHAHAAAAFRRAGFTVLSDAWPEGAKSGIVTVRKPGADDAEYDALFEKLRQRKIVASLRWDLENRPHLRFSPHFYNTEGDLDAAVAALTE